MHRALSELLKKTGYTKLSATIAYISPQAGTMEKKRIYMAGAGGMLGEAFYHQFNEAYEIKCSDIDTNESWLSYLDFRDADAYEKAVRAFGADYLFHLGAHTDLEYCEQHPDDSYLTNTLAVEHAVRIANKLDIPILYISTAGIFDGKQDTYDDWDTPNPLGVYARSKYMGERYVCEHAKRYLVCRAGWMMGAGPSKDKKFIQKLMKQLRDGKTELHIVSDKDGTPTYTHDFAETVHSLLKREYWGLYNMVCGGITSRLEVAQEMLRILGKADKVTIHPVSSAYFKETYFAARPPSERLLTKKLDLLQVNKMRDWRVALEEYLRDYYANYL